MMFDILKGPTTLFTLVFMTTRLFAVDSAKLPDLGNVPKTAIADIRTFDDSEYNQVRIVEITTQVVTFEQNATLKSLNRTDVFRIVADSRVFTDTGLTSEENSAIESGRDFKAEYLDFVLLLDYTRYTGRITALSEKQIDIEQDKVLHSVPTGKILAYRKDRLEKKIVDRAIPPHWLRRWGAVQEDRWHFTEGIIGISSPLNIFPQLTFGIQTNSSWPIYVGSRFGASGNLITAGWYYAQAQFYLGANLLQIAYVQTSLVAGYLYRNHFMNTPISCDCAPGSTGYFFGFTTVNFKQKNYYVGIALKFRNLYVELGWEIHDYFSASVTPPDVKNPPVSVENQIKIEKSIADGYSFASGISGYSRLYFSLGYQLFML